MASSQQALRIVLIVVGVVFIAGLYPLTLMWPDGFMWEPRQAEYEQMILLTQAVLGVFLILASRDPLKHNSLIWFAAWSSLLHGLLMLVQALRDPAEKANLMGDVPALIIVGVVLGVLMRAASRESAPAAP
jgi:drug/metabolite transporter (DMT)-like permease